MERSVSASTGYTFRTKNISRRVQRITTSPIKEMSLLAYEVGQKSNTYIISFGQGIPYLDTPEHIKEGIRQALLQKDTARYTLYPGIPELRILIAQDLTERKGVAINADQIIVTTGCQEALVCALSTLVDEGDEVILISPSFPSYSEQVLQIGGIPVFVGLDEENGWHVNEQAVRSAITLKTKVILFSHPSNPTGTVFTKEELRGIANIAKEKDLVIITDETYDFLVYDNKEFVSPISFQDIQDRVILCGSFSKKYSLTGYRVGYAVAEQGIIEHMLKIHDMLAICSPAISQKAAIVALKGSQQHVLDLVENMTQNRNLICNELDKMPDFFEYVKPEGAYYVLAKYSLNMSSVDFAVKMLQEAKVVTIPGIAFGPAGENNLRFSFAGSPQEITEGFQRLQTWTESL